MTNDKPSTSTNPGDSSSPPVDTLAIATVVGVVVMIALSLWNVWNLGRLGDRVLRLEAALAATAAPSGPDPNLVHEVNIAGAQAKGSETAPVTIVEFSEFQCPFCAKVVPTLKQIEQAYEGKVRIVWKHFPLPFHKNAVDAAVAAEAAGRQGRFWEYHDTLFANQSKLTPDDLKQYANALELDMARFEADLANGEDRKRVDADVAEAAKLGIDGTPG